MLLNSTNYHEDGFLRDFSLIGVDNQLHSTKDYPNCKGILIVFTCNHCPYAKASWPILVQLYNKFCTDIAFIAVNSNDSSIKEEDSFEGMQKLTRELGVKFAYLHDESQDVAKLFNAQCTPDPFLFKNEANVGFKLFYHGRINDNWQNPDKVSDHSLANAMKKLVADQPAPTKQLPSMGCSIKFKSV